MFPVVAFDLDGTLVDTAPDLAAALNHALGCLGLAPVEPASVRAMVGEGARRLLERGLAANGADPALADTGLPHFLDHYRANIARLSRPFPDAEATLEQLAAEGARLAICTNKPEALARALLAELGWVARFAAVLGADSRGFRKPDPRHLLATIAAAGGGAAAYVGDSATDSATAQAAGIPFILVAHGYHGGDPAAIPADARIGGLAHLPQTLRRVQAEFPAAWCGP